MTQAGSIGYPPFRRVEVEAKARTAGGRTLLLASRSPRRRLLLEEAGAPHEVLPPPVDDAELRPGEVMPRGWVMALAHFKSRLVAEMSSGREGCVILGADTIVEKDAAVIGQPRDEEDARRIMRTLRDGRHCVLTGVSLLDPAHGAQDLFFDEAVVEVGPIDDETIERYLAGGDWRGKAGGYNLRERKEAGWPIRVSGDPATVMGLPIRRLLPRLRRMGVKIGGAAADSPPGSTERADTTSRSGPA